MEKTEIVKVNQVNIECPFENEQHYVAVRSICQALGIDHKSQFERIKNDEILKDVYTVSLYASDSSNSRKQEMFCIPLKFVFGWIFSIDDSKVSERAKPTFLRYKLECYNALYEHFNGTIINRQKLIKEKVMLQKERVLLETDLRNDTRFVKLEEIKAGEARIGKNLKRLDDEEITQQLSLFDEK